MFSCQIQQKLDLLTNNVKIKQNKLTNQSLLLAQVKLTPQLS